MRVAKETSDRESRERRLSARAISQSLNDGLSGAAAAATAPASVGEKSSKGTSSVDSPPRNLRNERNKSADAERPVTSKGRRSSGRRVSPEKSTPGNSDAEGSENLHLSQNRTMRY